MKRIACLSLLAVCLAGTAYGQDNVVDEIVWVVGDEAILRSDVETQRLYMQNEGQRFDGDPYCIIPEQIAIQKLYLNQAKIDSIDVSESQVLRSVDQWINMAINQVGGREKLEEYFNKKLSQIKEERKTMVREQQIVQEEEARGQDQAHALGRAPLFPERATGQPAHDPCHRRGADRDSGAEDPLRGDGRHQGPSA